jgi:DNA-binding transcriptional regulator PaaX
MLVTTTLAERTQNGALARSFAPAPPRVAHERILRIHRYSDLTRVRPAIARAAQAMAALAETLSEPRAAYRRVRIETLRDGVLELDGGVRLRCPAFDAHLAGCHEVAPFVLTLGPRLPEKVIELAEAGDLLEGLFLETAGWLCIEDATRQLKTHLRSDAARTRARITSRMGPGYSYKVGDVPCVWALEENAALFRLLGERLPVTLLASSAMSPKMSRSGMYGIAPLSSPRSAP